MFFFTFLKQKIVIFAKNWRFCDFTAKNILLWFPENWITIWQKIRPKKTKVVKMAESVIFGQNYLILLWLVELRIVGQKQ